MLLSAVCSIGGCLHALHGERAARRMGDTSHPAARLPPGALADVSAACRGEHEVDERATDLDRPPYLQRVTTTDAYVVWTAKRAVGAVTVSRPGGATVGTFAAVVDADLPFARQQFVHVVGLAPDTIYCYELDEGGAAITNLAGFRTPPAAGTGKPTRFLAWGDSGGANDDQRAVARVLETVRADLAIIVGDVAYEHGTLAQLETTHFAIYRALERRIPIYPESGDHDYDTDHAAPFRQAFMLPDNGGPRGRERWWSFDWGDVHFVGLDTQDLAAEQTRWLDADLERSKARWKVAYLHRPPLSSGQHGSQADVRRRFTPLFEKHHVQLVLAGHDHDYERLRPLNGVTYIVSGGGGRSTRTVSTSSRTAFSLDVLHFLYVEADDERMTIHAIDATGTEFDSVVIPATS